MQPAPDRGAMHRHAMNRGQFHHDLVQRQIALDRQPVAHPTIKGRELAIAAMALALRHQPAAFALQDHHVIHEFRRNPEVTRGLAMAVAFRHKRNNSAEKLHRMWFTHPIPHHLLNARESHIKR